MKHPKITRLESLSSRPVYVSKTGLRDELGNSVCVVDDGACALLLPLTHQQLVAHEVCLTRTPKTVDEFIKMFWAASRGVPVDNVFELAINTRRKTRTFRVINRDYDGEYLTLLRHQPTAIAHIDPDGEDGNLRFVSECGTPLMLLAPLNDR